YGVFALADGRHSSRPATVPVTLLPPLSALEADTGPSEIVLHWSAHPAVREVRVTRTPEGGRPAPVPVTGNSCHLTGLTEGQEQYFEVVATYRGLDAGGQLRGSYLACRRAAPLGVRNVGVAGGDDAVRPGGDRPPRGGT